MTVHLVHAAGAHIERKDSHRLLERCCSDELDGLHQQPAATQVSLSSTLANCDPALLQSSCKTSNRSPT